MKSVKHCCTILDMYNTQHTYIHMVWNQIGFGGVSDAPEPCFDESLHLLEKVKLSHIPLEQSQKG